MQVKAAPRNKADFYARYDAGEFGNRPRTWASTTSLAADTYHGKVVARSTYRGGPCRYGVPKEEAVQMSGMRFNEVMPDSHLLMQGEVFRNELGLQLAYDTTPGKMMREAMKTPLTARGIVAQMLMRTVMWPNSYHDIMQLLDDYDNAVVEFGVYATAVGDCPRRNTVIWEVRDY